MTAQTNNLSPVVANPPFFTAIYESNKWAWIWLVVRLYLGYDWVTSGLAKIGNPVWMNGTIIKGFWTKAIIVPDAPAMPAVAFDWYRAFLSGLLASGAQTWFAPLVAYSEVLIGIALVLGLFTWIAALAGGFMNWNFIMAGTASVNGVFIVLSFLLILAWRTAGWWGLDRWLLPQVGTPWKLGSLFKKES